MHLNRVFVYTPKLAGALYIQACTVRESLVQGACYVCTWDMCGSVEVCACLYGFLQCQAALRR